jgi:hypothetical protein
MTTEAVCDFLSERWISLEFHVLVNEPLRGATHTVEQFFVAKVRHS